MTDLIPDPDKMPRHIAIIMDGNGRWAQQHGHERTFGHKSGVDAVKSVIEGAGELKIPYLTLYAFSTENWNRPKEEVDMLMALLVEAVHNELDDLMKNRVRLTAIGRTGDLPDDSRKALLHAMDKTSRNTGLTVSLALSYSGRTELIDATRAIAEKARQGLIRPQDITADTIRQHLYKSGLPDPDILIRTGGEQRISNFLLWEIAYTELFFTPVLWPDFRKDDLKRIVCEYQTRERRYGKTGEQIRHGI